jgi:hypothetical protein
MAVEKGCYDTKDVKAGCCATKGGSRRKKKRPKR